MNDDFADLIEDVGKTAFRYALVLALLVGGALFALGFLWGRFG